MLASASVCALYEIHEDVSWKILHTLENKIITCSIYDVPYIQRVLKATSSLINYFMNRDERIYLGNVYNTQCKVNSFLKYENCRALRKWGSLGVSQTF